MTDATRRGGTFGESEQRRMERDVEVMHQMPVMPLGARAGAPALPTPTDHPEGRPADVIEQAGIRAEPDGSGGAMDVSERQAATQDPWDGP
jgi:hypothetical protein